MSGTRWSKGRVERFIAKQKQPQKKITRYYLEKRAKNAITHIFHGCNENESKFILNTISVIWNQYNDCEKYLKLGDSLEGMKELQRTLNNFDKKKSTLCKTQREILLTSILKLNSNHDPVNKSFVKNLLSFRSGHVHLLLKKIISNKKEFNDNKTLALSNITPIKRKRYPQCIIDNAKNFWFEMSHPNPSQWRRVTMWDKDGNKFLHPRHIIYMSYQAMYEFWRKNIFEEYVKTRIIKRVPSYDFFRTLKPEYIYPSNRNDFGHCTLHSNLKHKWNVLKNFVHKERLHKCKTSQCRNYWEEGKDGVCYCDDCEKCQCYTLFSSSMTNVCRLLCCENENNDEFPKSDCWRGICGCVKKNLKNYLEGSLCKGWKIKQTDEVKFWVLEKTRLLGNKQWQEYDNIDIRTWREFKDLLYDEMPSYVSHHVRYIFNFRNRKNLVSRKKCNMTEDTMYLHCDYINKIKIQSKFLTDGKWPNRFFLSLFVAILRYPHIELGKRKLKNNTDKVTTNNTLMDEYFINQEKKK